MAWAVFDESHLRAINEILTTASDRVVAVVGGAFLEDSVDRTLRERFRNVPGLVDSILGIDRPLGSIGPKIDVLHLLYAFDEPTRNALKGISSVRNFFAHNIDASFDSRDEMFVKAMKRLTLHQGKIYYPHHLYGGDGAETLEAANNNRTQFIINLRLGLIALMRDRVSHKVYTNEAMTEDEIKAQFERKPDAERS